MYFFLHNHDDFKQNSRKNSVIDQIPSLGLNSVNHFSQSTPSLPRIMYLKGRFFFGYMTKQCMFRAQILLDPWKFYTTAGCPGCDI